MLAKMNSYLKDDKKAVYWNQRANELENAINRELWCERTRFYHDRSIAPNFINSKTVACFWTILAQIAKGERLDSLVGYLRDEKTFNRPMPIPSLSADDCNYCGNGTYWIGGVWAPTNYMVTRGLMLAGQGDLAHDIATKYLNGLAAVYKNLEPHSLWECYSPDKPLPGLDAYNRQFVKPDFVGWTGIGPIAMLIENILGVEMDAPRKQIDWHIRLQESHGVGDLKLGDATVNLKCEFIRDAKGTLNVHIESDKEITVRIFYGKKMKIIKAEGIHGGVYF